MVWTPRVPEGGHGDGQETDLWTNKLFKRGGKWKIGKKWGRLVGRSNLKRTIRNSGKCRAPWFQEGRDLKIPPKEEVRKDDQIKDGVAHRDLVVHPLRVFGLYGAYIEAYGSSRTHRAIIVQSSNPERTKGCGCGDSQRDTNHIGSFRSED